MSYDAFFRFSTASVDSRGSIGVPRTAAIWRKPGVRDDRSELLNRVDRRPPPIPWRTTRSCPKAVIGLKYHMVRAKSRMILDVRSPRSGAHHRANASVGLCAAPGAPCTRNMSSWLAWTRWRTQQLPAPHHPDRPGMTTLRIWSTIVWITCCSRTCCDLRRASSSILSTDRTQARR
jgi:hypothetical protein